jgi:hypothetical protein
MENVLHWAEEHPWVAGGVTLGAVFLLLWLFGFFGSSSSASSSGSNLAAAYYAAEAAQTTASTQLQMATVAYGNQTAQTQIQANAAEAIATTQAGAATTINGQNTGAAMTINGQNTGAAQTIAGIQGNTAATINAQNTAAATTIAGYDAQTQQVLSSNQLQGLIATSSDQLQATIHSADDAAATAVSAQNYSYLTTQAGYDAQLAQQLAAGTITAELSGRGLNLGIWTPSSGQVSSTGSTVGGPIDPATIAQWG